MSTDVTTRAGTDLGLDRSFDLSRATVRARSVRRRLGIALFLVVGIGGIATATTVWPWTIEGPPDEVPFVVREVGLALLGLALVVALVGVGTMVRAGSTLFEHDPLLDLPRHDRAWVRARVAASAPVSVDQHEVVVAAARWLARQPGAVPSYLSQVLMGVGFTLLDLGVVGLVLGLVLVVQGVVLAALALDRARTARRWLSLYARAEVG